MYAVPQLYKESVSEQCHLAGFCILCPWSWVTASVSVWWESVLGVNLSGRESRLEPDSTLFVMQILECLTANLLYLVDVILVGLQYRLLYSAHSGLVSNLIGSRTISYHFCSYVARSFLHTFYSVMCKFIAKRGLY